MAIEIIGLGWIPACAQFACAYPDLPPFPPELA
jgi:hypothetical protein